MSLKKYFALGKIHLYERWRYFLENSVYSIFLIAIIFIFFNMWKAIYGDEHSIADFSFTQMLWYLTFAEVLQFSISIYRIEKIGEEVKSGSLSNALLKPYHFLGREFSIITSDFLYNFLLFGIIGLIFCYLFVGLIDFSLMGLIITAFVTIGSLVLNYFIVTSFGMVALWTEESSSLFWLYQKAIFILGGMLLPLSFYPSWLQRITAFLPTTYVMYGPARLFVSPSFEFFVTVILGQVIWSIIFFSIMILIYRKGIREVSLNGG